MQLEVVPVDALVGEETLSRLFNEQLITSELGPEPSVLFLFLELIKGLCGSQQNWEDMSYALQIGLL